MFEIVKEEQKECEVHDDEFLQILTTNDKLVSLHEKEGRDYVNYLLVHTKRALFNDQTHFLVNQTTYNMLDIAFHEKV